jgi:hypothetical protein
LTKRDLGAYDGKALDAIEAVANSAPYLGDEAYRNALILDTELRSSNVLTHFFRDGGVVELQPGFNLLRDERAWEKVSNTVFFNAIRMAWNNYSLRMTPLHAEHPSMTSAVRNADVVWLENWVPITYLDPESRMEMAFTHAEVWDIRARARKLQQLLEWQEEGAVVERWIENCSQSSTPSRMSLGRHLGIMWQRELKRRTHLSEIRPEFASEWQPPGADLLEENRFHCNDGPIGFALDAISQ